MVSRLFPVALARGKHLFPFRTEQLSPSAPMVLGPQGPGRVGRRRFFLSRQRTAQAVRLSLHGDLSRPACFDSRRRAPAADAWWQHHQRGTGKHVLPDSAHRLGEAEGARAAALGADGASAGARSGRPPSRRHCRPRAKGTSGSNAGHRVRAGQTLMFAMTGTCVRKIGTGSDGPGANRCTCRQVAPDLACQSEVMAFRLQSKLQIGAKRVGRWPEAVPRQGTARPPRTPVAIWLLR